MQPGFTMPTKELFLIYVIDGASESENELAEQYRSQKAICNFRNARYFRDVAENCNGVILGNRVDSQFPGVRSAYEAKGIAVKNLDEPKAELEEIEPDSIPIEREAEDIYSWTREQCLNWLSVRGIRTPSGYASKADLQALILEHVNG